jgi:ribonuclease Z
MAAMQVFDINRLDHLAHHLAGPCRILIWGAMGTGKSTLAMDLSRRLTRSAGACQILELDPGRPPFGVPGALSRGWWSGDRPAWADLQALCSLDAARFRLPLILAARRLMAIIERSHGDGPVVIDPPGVVKGAGGAELLMALIESLSIDVVVVCSREETPLPLAAELSSRSVELIGFPASPAAGRPSAQERADQRTRLWEDYLDSPLEEIFPLAQVPLLGTPPPIQVPRAWPGRQAALLDAAGETIRMGEVLRLTDGKLILKLRAGPVRAAPAGILIRDAGRNAAGRLETMARTGNAATACRMPPEMIPPAAAHHAGWRPVAGRVGPAWATLTGGVFGDPLLHVRLRHLKRSYFFDLGDPARLAAKVAHQVQAVFLSHAHIDHIGGFLWFLRSRIGLFGPCRIFGPAGIIDRIESHINAVTWDRIEANAPVFDVFEIHGAVSEGARLQPGHKTIALPGQPVENGVILADENVRVSATVCDHGIPSVAYAMAFTREISVRKKELASSGWPPGPWLGRLKQLLAAGRPATDIRLPDGTIRRSDELAAMLTIVRPGQKLVYAADMADTPSNRAKLVNLARGAHTLFCETAFARADKSRADATQHLTTAATVAIARQAGVERLAPFHFSKRYEHTAGKIYAEILTAAGPVRILGSLPKEGLREDDCGL